LITRSVWQKLDCPILPVGVATGLIGDPRGTMERKLTDRDDILNNFKKLKKQLQSIFPYEYEKYFIIRKGKKILLVTLEFGS
jgi:tyrosyl-tRNA synthetase